MKLQLTLLILALCCSTIYCANLNYAGFTYKQLDQYFDDCRYNHGDDICDGEIDATNTCYRDLARFGYIQDEGQTFLNDYCFNSTDTTHPCYIWKNGDINTAEQLVDFSARQCFEECFGPNVVLLTESSNPDYQDLVDLKQCLYDVKDRGFFIPNYGGVTYFDLYDKINKYCVIPSLRGCNDGEQACVSDQQVYEGFLNVDPNLVDPCNELITRDQWEKDPDTGKYRFPDNDQVIDVSAIACIDKITQAANYQTFAYQDYYGCVYDVFWIVMGDFDPFDRTYRRIQDCEDNSTAANTAPNCDGEQGLADPYCQEDLRLYNSIYASDACRWANLVAGGDIRSRENADKIVSEFALDCAFNDYFHDYKGSYFREFQDKAHQCTRNILSNSNPRAFTYSALDTCLSTHCVEPTCEDGEGLQDGEACLEDLEEQRNVKGLRGASCWNLRHIDGEATDDEIIDVRFLECVSGYRFKTQRFLEYQQCTLGCYRNETVISSGVTPTEYDQCLVQYGCTTGLIDCLTVTDRVEQEKCFRDQENYHYYHEKDFCYYSDLINRNITGDTPLDASFAACQYKIYTMGWNSQIYNQRAQCEQSCVQDHFPGVASFIYGEVLKFSILVVMAIIGVLLL